MNENTMLAIAIASIAGCTASGSFAPKAPPEYPGTACVRAAWSHADRLECVKAQIVTIAPKADEQR